MIALTLAIAIQSSYIPTAWLEARGVRVRNARGMGRGTIATMDGSGRLVRLDYEGHRTWQPGRFSWPIEGSDPDVAAVTRYTRDLPSGMGLGTEWRIYRGHGGDSLVRVRYLTPWTTGSVQVRNVDAKGRETAPSADRAHFAEGLARHALALAEGRRLELSGTRLLNGVTLAEGEAGSTTMVPLTGWAKARGWAAGVDDDLGLCTLAKGGRTLKVPLGGASVKLDGLLKSLPEVVMLKDGKWWVPLNALEAAVTG